MRIAEYSNGYRQRMFDWQTLEGSWFLNAHAVAFSHPTKHEAKASKGTNFLVVCFSSTTRPPCFFAYMPYVQHVRPNAALDHTNLLLIPFSLDSTPGRPFHPSSGLTTLDRLSLGVDVLDAFVGLSDIQHICHWDRFGVSHFQNIHRSGVDASEDERGENH